MAHLPAQGLPPLPSFQSRWHGKWAFLAVNWDPDTHSRSWLTPSSLAFFPKQLPFRGEGVCTQRRDGAPRQAPPSLAWLLEDMAELKQPCGWVGCAVQMGGQEWGMGMSEHGDVCETWMSFPRLRLLAV